MKNQSCICGAILLILLMTILPSCNNKIDSRSGLIADQVAMFYPADFDSSAHMPSFALVREFPKTGKIPYGWKMIPVFYHSGKKSCVSIPFPKGASLYGSGEVSGPLLRNGRTITLWNTDNYTYKKFEGKQLYQSHPWVLGVNTDGTAFGIIADNTWKQDLILNDSIKFIAESPAFRVIVIQKSSVEEVMKAFTDLVGTIELPPLWSLGYQQSRYSYQPDSRVREVAGEFRKRNIPCDVIWMDIDYMDGFRIFTFDRSKFPDPKALNDYLHKMDFKSVWMIDPGVKKDSDYFVYVSGSKGENWVKDKYGNDFTGKVWPGVCKFPDFTRPETQRWWAGLYLDFMAKGIDGVWNDMNEPSVFDSENLSMPADNLHRGGGPLKAGPHLRYHNVYGMLMIRSSREGLLKANPDKRPFILSRSGFLGSHRYGATWTGDNSATFEHMELSIPMLLNLGLSGQAFCGPDISGFDGMTSKELYSHWIATGAFYPFARGHAAVGTNDKEPWAFGPEVEKVARIALNRRYRLIPYYYTIFREASETGMPVMRPVFMADVRDTSLRGEKQAFMIGRDLLIVPKWAVRPTLPSGNWRIVSIAGESSLKDLYQPDVRIRDGAIVPLCNLIQNTSKYRTDSITLLVSVDSEGKAKGSLYEDDGDGYGYKSGQFAVTTFSALSDDGKITVKMKKIDGKMSLKPKTYRIEIYSKNGITETGWQKGDNISVKYK
jgi:alpha-glucosidase